MVLHTLVRPPATRRCRYTSRASSFTFRHRLEKLGSLLFTFRRSQLYTLNRPKVQYRKRYYRVLYEFRPMGRRTTSPGVHNLKEHVQ